MIKQDSKIVSILFFTCTISCTSHIRSIVCLQGQLGLRFSCSIADVLTDVSFDLLNNYGAIDVKMDWSTFDGKSSFKVLGLSFLDVGLLNCLYG